MDNEASRAFGSFPDRLYILLDGKIVYMVCSVDKFLLVKNGAMFQGGVGPHGYNTFEIEEWLEKYFS